MTNSIISRTLTEHPTWDWDNASGALVYIRDLMPGLVDGLDEFITGHVTLFGLESMSCESWTPNMLYLALSAPSTHGVLLSMIHATGAPPPSMRAEDEDAEEYGKRLASRLLSYWVKP